MSKEHFDPANMEARSDQEKVSHEKGIPEIELSNEEMLLEQLEQAQIHITELNQKVDENHQNYLRALADLENYRRRARKDKEDALKYANVPLLENLLSVLDNFERALAATNQNQDVKLLQQGIEMVYRQLTESLSKFGLTTIEAVGKPFNPHEHNAVMQVASSEHDSGIVLEELQVGYRFKDRVIRPTMVKVSE